MCYASPVMLQGRCSCAISECPTPSSTPINPLSPLFPLHPRNSPVSPFFPLHTQKQGGGVHFPVHHLPPSLPLLPSRSPLATCHSPLTPIIPAPLATAALRVVPAPIFTTTLSTHVGAPTILFRERTTASQQFPDRRAMLSSNCALLTVDCELLSPLSPIIPALTRGSPVSPIIPALTQNRGVGVGNAMV